MSNNSALKIVNNIAIKDINHQIRAERFDPKEFAIKMLAKLGGKDIEVSNISETGAAITTEFQVKENEQLPFVLTFNDRVIYQGNSHIAWVDANDGKYFVGLTFVSGYLGQNQIKAFEILSYLGNEIYEDMNRFNNVDGEFKKLTFEIKYFLEKVKGKLDKVEKFIEVESMGTKKSYEVALDSVLGSDIIAKLIEYNKQLDVILCKRSFKHTLDNYFVSKSAKAS